MTEQAPEQQETFEPIVQLFTPEQIAISKGVRATQDDFDDFARVSDSTGNFNAWIARSRTNWAGLAKCYWYSTHEHPLHVPPPLLPGLPLRFEVEGDIHSTHLWHLELGSLIQLLNRYHAFKLGHPELKQTDILSRHMWNANLGFLKDFVTYRLEKEALSSADVKS